MCILFFRAGRQTHAVKMKQARDSVAAAAAAAAASSNVQAARSNEAIATSANKQIKSNQIVSAAQDASAAFASSYSTRRSVVNDTTAAAAASNHHSASGVTPVAAPPADASGAATAATGAPIIHLQFRGSNRPFSKRFKLFSTMKFQTIIERICSLQKCKNCYLKCQDQEIQPEQTPEEIPDIITHGVDIQFIFQ